MRTKKLLSNEIFRITTIVLALTFSISSCTKTFDYSVYSSYVPAPFRDSREGDLEELSKIENEIPDGSQFKFALVSDSHTSYNDLEDFAKTIKDKDDISFILHGGDLTDGGMLAEYQIFHNIMESTQKPYFPVIGNHDCLANGLSIYNDMFGKDDYTVEFKNCKFIFFNDIVWELDNREPEYFWLVDQLSDTAGFEHVFLVSHISPVSDSFDPFESYTFTEILKEYKIDLAVHGHDHSFKTGIYEGVDYLIIGSVDKRYYIEITVDNDSININQQTF